MACHRAPHYLHPCLYFKILTLFRLKGLKKAFESADDVAILKISPLLDINSTKIKETIHEALTWGKEEGVTFDPKNSELMHFTRGYKDKGNSPQVLTSSFGIS